jgi:thiamine-monophosphate kinase
MGRTEIETIGEFGLIRRMTEDVELTNESSVVGVGDDAAVLNYAEKQVLVTTDLLLEGIHFDLTYVPLKHLGYKSAIVNFSDIYAMNGRPKQLTVSLGISKRFSVEDIEAFYEGLKLACKLYGVDLVGGDTSSSLTGLCISITCIGEGETEKISYRNGAKEGDVICVTGDLGAAYLGLQLLEREKLVFEASFKTSIKASQHVQPDFSGKEYLLERQLKPEARRDIITALGEKNIVPSSMIDISDGLSSELLHICVQSNVGSLIYMDKIPVHSDTQRMAEQFGMDATTVALHGGEDYELLFTVSVPQYAELSAMKEIKIIGRVEHTSFGNRMRMADGEDIEIVAQGWNGFAIPA